MNTQTTMVQFNGMTGVSILTKAGKQSGVRLAFDKSGGFTASQIRSELKAKGVKGRELTRKVNDVLTGETDFRWAKHEAAISILRSQGYVPDYVDTKAKGATAKFFMPTSPVKGVTKVDALEVLAASMGITVDDLSAMLSTPKV